MALSITASASNLPDCIPLRPPRLRASASALEGEERNFETRRGGTSRLAFELFPPGAGKRGLGRILGQGGSYHIYHNLFSRFSIYEYLICSQFFATTRKTAMKVLLYMGLFCHSPPWGICLVVNQKLSLSDSYLSLSEEEWKLGSCLRKCGYK
ncbi:KRAB-A domain-containing protein 2 isoform X4 [Petaurus breviceps papuanus]|uniref:KRAB-A domain-containing protein 2 isoform X4 n=1 Tax=Petaurus breviceps papuanus TaxID=3040969 RepID=UPI0036D97EDA